MDQSTFKVGTPFQNRSILLGGLIAIFFSVSVQAEEWVSVRTPIPAVQFESVADLKNTLADHAKVATYFDPNGPLVVRGTYQSLSNPDASTALRYEVGMLGIRRQFQGDVRFDGCNSSQSVCSLSVDLSQSSAAIRGMIPRMRIEFQVSPANSDGSIQVTPRVTYLKGPNYEEMLRYLGTGIIEKTVKAQIDPLLQALERYQNSKIKKTGELIQQFNRNGVPALSPRSACG